MATLKRNYKDSTIKELFALSGDQCTNPDCSNPIIQPATDCSDAIVSGQICHIYAVGAQGPRGNPGLTQEELNLPENLILLCCNCHRKIDGQHETYPASLLKEWKQTHQSKMQKRLSADSTDSQADVFPPLSFPFTLVNQKIVEEIENLRKLKLFPEFDRVNASLTLGGRLSERDLSSGSDELRSQGLAWCARLLSRSDALDKAEEFLRLARHLGDSSETQIAEAFILSKKGDKGGALRVLAEIDSGASHSASLTIVERHDGAKGAVRWMTDAGYTAEHLDSDGKSLLLNYQLQLGNWNGVTQTVDYCFESDFVEAPILHHLVALSKLIVAVPDDFRVVVLAQVPFEAAEFPLASSAHAMDARRASHTHFLEGSKAAMQLACPRIAKTDDEYALWLELRDPEQCAYGKSRLENKLRDPNTALCFVHYALQFGVKLDLDVVERNIEQNSAINGGMTIDGALARFALVFAKPNPEEAANYIDRHFTELSAHIDLNLMQKCLIKFLSRAGLTERANVSINQFIEQGASADQESQLRQIISDAQGIDPVKSSKEQYRSTGDLSDLILLVAELEECENWEDTCEFGRLLFEETHSLADAEHLVRAFNNMHRSAELVEFLKVNSELLSQSRYLQMSYAWGLYDEGALLESRAALMNLSDDTASSNYRSLVVSLGITMGDWASLSAHIVSEYQNRNDRSANELLETAHLALHVGSPHTRDLILEATVKGNDDASILVGAYFIAARAGWEDDLQVYQWLEQAAELSSDDGPIQRIDLKDILDRKPEWDRRESDIWRLLEQGQMPIYMAAEFLHRTLIDLTTFPAFANLSEIDLRHRTAIPAYSGNRSPQHFDLSGKRIALDATALLTLSYLGILDAALDAIETVYIPHSTLEWLFEEQQRATFHQPSRIKNAHTVRDLLATNALQKFAPSTNASSDLSVQVGDDLAAFIAEAEKIREGNESQHIVVRPSPVFRLSTLMEEEADLSAHTSVLSSCSAVVRKLKQKGQITANEEKRAYYYLQLQEKLWPDQPDIADGSVLYLDDLSITYLLHLGLLGKLKDAGLNAVISSKRVSEVDALIGYERISEEVKDVIDHIRESLNSRIESGKIKVSCRKQFVEGESKSISEHPTVDIIGLAPYCDAAIVDDRLVNQRANISSDGIEAPVLSTLDLLDAFVSETVISEDDWLEYRTTLRRAGYFFVPVSEKELERCLKASEVNEGHVLENAELKAIRESLLHVRMSNRLQIPEETPWLDSTFRVFVQVLKSLWMDGEDFAVTSARSDWILDQVDFRGWSHRLGPGSEHNIVRIGWGAHIPLFTLPVHASQKVKDAYSSWVEDRILAPIKEQFPDGYSWIVEQQRKWVSEIANMDLPGGNRYEQ